MVRVGYIVERCYLQCCGAGPFSVVSGLEVFSDPDSDVFWIRNTDLGSKKKIKMLNRLEIILIFLKYL